MQWLSTRAPLCHRESIALGSWEAAFLGKARRWRGDTEAVLQGFSGICLDRQRLFGKGYLGADLHNLHGQEENSCPCHRPWWLRVGILSTLAQPLSIQQIKQPYQVGGFLTHCPAPFCASPASPLLVCLFLPSPSPSPQLGGQVPSTVSRTGPDPLVQPATGSLQPWKNVNVSWVESFLSFPENPLPLGGLVRPSPLAQETALPFHD